MNDTPFLRTTAIPTGLRVAQVVGLTSTAFLAGKTFTQTWSAVPALLHAPAPLLAKQWKIMVDSDKFLAPLIVVYSSGVFGWLAWREPTLSTHTSLLHTISTTLLIATIPYSLLLLEPLNQALEDRCAVLSFKASEAGMPKEQTTHWLVDRWATVNLGRAVLSGVAAVAAIWAGVQGAGVGGMGGGIGGVGVKTLGGKGRMG